MTRNEVEKAATKHLESDYHNKKGYDKIGGNAGRN